MSVKGVRDGQVGVDGASLVVRVKAAEAVVVGPLIVTVAGAV